MAVNVKAVVNEIKAEIEESKERSDIPTFAEVMSVLEPSVVEYDGAELRSLICAYNENSYIIESTPIKGNRFIAFIKRIIRKLTRFYIRPIVDKQNSINAMTGRVLIALDNDMQRVSLCSMGEYAEKYALLELKFNKLDSKTTMLLNRVNELEAENKALKEKLK